MTMTTTTTDGVLLSDIHGRLQDYFGLKQSQGKQWNFLQIGRLTIRSSILLVCNIPIRGYICFPLLLLCFKCFLAWNLTNITNRKKCWQLDRVPTPLHCKAAHFTNLTFNKLLNMNILKLQLRYHDNTTCVHIYRSHHLELQKIFKSAQILT